LTAALEGCEVGDSAACFAKGGHYCAHSHSLHIHDPEPRTITTAVSLAFGSKGSESVTLHDGFYCSP